MSTEQSAISARQKELLKQYLDRFRETAKGATKTALLWSAALAIVWLTGLERVHHDVTETFNAIQRNNWTKQKYVESQVNKDFKSIRDLEFRINEESVKEEEEYLQKHKNRLAQALKKGDNKKADTERQIIEQLSKYTEEQKRKVEGYKKTLDEKKRRIEEQTKVIEGQRKDLHKGLQELRAKKKGVSFDILGQKFEVSPLYAPILWSLFLIGLIGYLFRARLVLLDLCARM